MFFKLETGVYEEYPIVINLRLIESVTIPTKSEDEDDYDDGVITFSSGEEVEVTQKQWLEIAKLLEMLR